MREVFLLLRSGRDSYLLCSLIKHPQPLNPSKNSLGFSTDIHRVGDWQLVPHGNTIVLECSDETEGTSHCEVSIFGEKKRHVEMVQIGSYIKRHREEDTKELATLTVSTSHLNDSWRKLSCANTNCPL